MVFMPHWPPKYPPSGKIHEVLSLLGNPHTKLPPIFHFTGTNGKGSTIAFLKQIFQEHGLKTHIFTSPHLLKFNENFIIKNQMICDDTIFKLTEEIRIKLEDKIKPSFFEYQTALAFLAFSRTPADLCLIECGMGAKNDPTNILRNKLLSIITPITLDHEEFLGDSIEKITADKAHIINCPTICAPQYPIVKTMLGNFSKLQNCKIINYESDYDFEIIDDKLAYIDIKNEEISYYNLPSLFGDHQITNLVTAITTIKNQRTFNLDHDIINQAIHNTTWPGRLEKIENFPHKYLPQNSEIWFDGAHNEAGAYALNNWITKQADHKKNIIIYGRSANKKHHQFEL